MVSHSQWNESKPLFRYISYEFAPITTLTGNNRDEVLISKFELWTGLCATQIGLKEVVAEHLNLQN